MNLKQHIIYNIKKEVVFFLNICFTPVLLVTKLLLKSWSLAQEIDFACILKSVT